MQYNAVQFPTGASAAYALQESFHLPSIFQTVGGNGGVSGAAADVSGSGGSSGSGDHLDPGADDLLAGIQMISGNDASPIQTEYKDWLLCNSPQGMAPSPRNLN
jgi:hypothetical protein